MSYFKKIFEFYLDASIHVGLAVASLYLVTSFWLNNPVNYYLIGFIVSSTIVCYNFMKYGVEAEKYIIVKKSYHKIIQFFSFCCFPFAVYSFLNLPKVLWFPIAILALLSGLYILPFLPHAKNLRAFGGFKIYLVALIWVGFTVVLSVLESSTTISNQVVLMALKRFVLIIILFIPFEIRDVHVDEPEMKTLPQRIGIVKTKRVGYLLLGFYIVLSFLIWSNVWEIVLSDLIVAAILFLLIAKAKERQSKYFSAFWVEGIPILMVLLYVLFGQEF